MGEAKQLLPLAGRPLLAAVVDAAAGACLDEVVVVLGHRAGDIAAALALGPTGRVRWVENQDWASGMASSLRCGLTALGQEAAAAAVLLGDQVGLRPQFIDLVVGAYLAQERPAARPVYRATGAERQPGHPVILARKLWPDVCRLQGESGARELLALHPEWLCEVEVAGPAAADIDTPEDLRRAAAAGLGWLGRA
jgi:molybdenum cofactor cytidylyltransferase